MQLWNPVLLYILKNKINATLVITFLLYYYFLFKKNNKKVSKRRWQQFTTTDRHVRLEKSHDESVNNRKTCC